MGKLLALHYRKDTNDTEIFLENGEIRTEDGKPEKLINRWCLSCGSSMQGRLEAARYLADIRSKVPVFLSELSSTVLFPLFSSRSTGDNWWINDHMLIWMKAEERQAVNLIFADGTRIRLPYDIRILKRQRENCEKIRRALRMQKLPEEIASCETDAVRNGLGKGQL